MTRHPAPLALALVLVLPELGCKPACDETELARAAEAFAGRTPEQRRVGLDALGKACPTLPATLAANLEADFGELPPDERTEIYTTRIRDPAWQELFIRACPRSPEEHDRALGADDPDRALRRTCRLDRYELLAPDDVFIVDDVVPFMLLEWMVSGHVDRRLAADVVRPLLSASASADELEAMCREDDAACQWVLDAWGLTPPRSTAHLRERGGTELRIASAQLSVARQPVLTLASGRPEPDAFAYHVSSALRAALETDADAARAKAERDGTEWEPRLLVVADRATPAGTLTDALFTATKAGFRDVDLLVRADRGLRSLPVVIPRAWLPRSGEWGDARPHVAFVVHRNAVEIHVGNEPPRSFPAPAACEPAHGSCHDLPAIDTFVEQMIHNPKDAMAVFRVDADVPMQALVSLMDTVRGDGCPAPDDRGYSFPEQCRFHWVLLDAEPPLYFHADRPQRLVLDGAELEPLRDGQAPTASDRALLDAYPTARAELERCIAGHPEVTRELDDDARLHVLITAAKGRGHRTARVLLGSMLEGELERCILAPFGLEPDPRRPIDFLAAARIEIAIATRFVEP